LAAFPYPFQIPYKIQEGFKTAVQTILKALIDRKPVSQTCVFGKPGIITHALLPWKKPDE